MKYRIQKSGQHLLFASLSPVEPDDSPCASCEKSSPGGSFCSGAAECSELVEYIQRKRAHRKELEKKIPHYKTCACQNCTVSDVCPVAWEDQFTFCAIRTKANSLVGGDRGPLF